MVDNGVISYFIKFIDYLLLHLNISELLKLNGNLNLYYTEIIFLRCLNYVVEMRNHVVVVVHHNA